MINKVDQIMLYVNDLEAATAFWTDQLGFHLTAVNDNGQGMKWIEISPVEGAETAIVLHDKKLIVQMEPELNLGTPSLLFSSNDLDKLHEELSRKNVKIGEINMHPSGRVFNFADLEENYFAVLEKRD